MTTEVRSTHSNVATGWAEFLARLRGLASKGLANPDAAWTTFTTLAQNSPQREILATLQHLGNGLPEQERYRLAVGTTRLLAPIEWPWEWEAARPSLTDAISRLGSEMDPDVPESFFAQIATGKGAEARRLAHIAVLSAEELLRRPRRDQIKTIARLCNAGMAVCIETHRQCSKTMDGTELRAFGNAIADYTAAASLLNDATGVVLFEGLHAPLEDV